MHLNVEAIADPHRDALRANFVRCSRCGFFDREDFIWRRLLETSMRAGCGKCGKNAYEDARWASASEQERLRNGYYDRYRASHE